LRHRIRPLVDAAFEACALVDSTVEAVYLTSKSDLTSPEIESNPCGSVDPMEVFSGEYRLCDLLTGPIHGC
jgi:hypothetical protein